MAAAENRAFACCPTATWTRTEDLGHADGVEFTLGRCSVCGRYWMHLWTPHSPAPRYCALDEGTAMALRRIAPGPDRKRRLAEWFNA